MQWYISLNPLFCLSRNNQLKVPLFKHPFKKKNEELLYKHLNLVSTKMNVLLIYVTSRLNEKYLSNTWESVLMVYTVINVVTNHYIVLIWNQYIRIFNGSEVWIENAVMRVTVRHHLACKEMQNSYPERQNFKCALNNQYGFFFLHTLPLTITFKLKSVLFDQSYTKISTFAVKKCLVQLLTLAENDIKTRCH